MINKIKNIIESLEKGLDTHYEMINNKKTNTDYKLLLTGRTQVYIEMIAILSDLLESK